MYKGDVYTLELENESVEDLIRILCKGADIVFVTKKQKFMGGVTRGDVVRRLKLTGGKISLSELINTQMKYITYSNEEQVFQDAKVIFEKSKKIHNIPVVDTLGRILFQVNRVENRNAEESIGDILKAVENGSIEVFLEDDGIKEIILTGADCSDLQRAKDILEEQCIKLALKKEISICIVDDVVKGCIVEKGIRIISLSDLGAFYINKNTGFRAGALSTKELLLLYKFSVLKKSDEEAVAALKNIFGYEAVVFCSLNRYFSRLREMLERCGVQVYQMGQSKQYMVPDNYFIGALNVFCFQGEDCEVWNAGNLIASIGCLWRYKQITGCDLSRDEYLEAYIACMRWLKEEGFEGFLYEINNEWQRKLADMVKEKCDLQVIDKWEDVLSKKNYIAVSGRIIRKPIAGKICVVDRETVFMTACHYAVYQIINKLCKNIYTYTVSSTGMDLKVYRERTKYNYLEKQEMFPDGFVKDMYGDADYPLSEVIRDRDSCPVVKINEGYVKFSSNYYSRYFNTDAYGRRIVTNLPSEYFRTIWLVGNCRFSGYAVEDRDSLASYLQAEVNASSYSYRVVDLSCDGVEVSQSFNKILESGIHSDDIVILLLDRALWNDKIIKFDYKEISHYFSNKVWYWDEPLHSGPAVYKYMAEKIFKTIKKDMINKKGNYQFRVEKALECRIYDFITELEDRLKQDSGIIQLANNDIRGVNSNFMDGVKYKTGAIVMNCNPFTFGHQYLIETASRIVDLLYIFVVEEDKSSFRFEDRFRMVQDGVKQYRNVVVLPSGKFMISTVTFPGYFLKETPTRECYDSFLDLKIFGHYVAPALGISMRFVGEEPFDKVTAQYNRDMKIILRDAGIDVIEIPRKRYGSEVISATKVREFLKKKDYISLRKYVPETTIKYIDGII